MEEQEYIAKLEQEVASNSKLNPYTEANITSSLYANSQDQNLIVFQLELDSILEKLEHLLRGDIIKTDKEGNVFYTSTKKEEDMPLNDYGVKAIMNIISFYLNRNTILSYYQEDRINQILSDLGEELADFILCNYSKMGLNSDAKKSRYPLLVINILNTIESAYNRALRGREGDNLKTARIVTQNESEITPRGNFGGGGFQQKKKFNVLKPSTWA
jgi:hypothetical protein